MTTRAAVQRGRATPVLSVNVRPVTVAGLTSRKGEPTEGDSDFSSGSGLRLPIPGVQGVSPCKGSISKNTGVRP